MAAPAAKASQPFTPGSFRGELELVALSRGKGHQLPYLKDGRTFYADAKAFQYRTRAGDIISIPPGMTTDMASIPRLVQGALPPDGPWLKAAVIHDLLYKSRGTCQWIGPTGKIHYCHTQLQPYTRAEADQILLEAMEVLAVPLAQRQAIYWAVRLGGAKGWGH